MMIMIQHTIRHKHECGNFSWLLYIYLTGSFVIYPQNHHITKCVKPDLWGQFLVCYQSIKVVCVRIDKVEYEKWCHALKCSCKLPNRKKIYSVLIPPHALQILWTPKNIKIDTVFHVFVCVLATKYMHHKMASNAESVSIWWRQHGKIKPKYVFHTCSHTLLSHHRLT